MKLQHALITKILFNSIQLYTHTPYWENTQTFLVLQTDDSVMLSDDFLLYIQLSAAH